MTEEVGNVEQLKDEAVSDESKVDKADVPSSMPSEKKENGMTSPHSESEDLENIKEDLPPPPKKRKYVGESDSKVLETGAGRGRRESKKIERFTQEVKAEPGTEEEGWGTPIGEIPYIAAMINKFHVNELKGLHRLTYGRPGTSSMLKRSLRKFKGFAFTRNDAAFGKKKANLEKCSIAELKRILLILGLERGGHKTELVERVLEFLLDPHDKGKAAPVRKSKGKKKAQKKKAKTGKPKTKKQTKKEKVEGESEKESDKEKVDDEMEEQEQKDDEEQADGEQEEPEEKEMKKKPKAPQKKNAKAAKKTLQPKKSSKGRAAPQPKKKTTKKPPPPSPSSTSESESESDVSLKKMVKKEPTDEEISSFIGKLLKNADLEEVTMKKLCQQVYDNYPSHNLSQKKDFIKDTVKKILS